MFDTDSIKEIFLTIKQNKLRTFLTGFSIAWGIFILIVLLGAGTGLKNGVTSNFSRRAQNTIGLYPGYTTLPYAGFPLDRQIKFDYKDMHLIEKELDGVSHITPVLNKSVNLSHNKEYGAWTLRGVYPDAEFIYNLTISEGRFINQSDLDRLRKEIVISPEMKEILFKGASPIGQYVVADSIAYQVVGVYKDEGSMGSPPAYIPFTTGQALYRKFYGMDKIEFVVPSLNSVEKSKEFEDIFRDKLGKLHKFDPKDRSAIYIQNTAEHAAQATTIFWAINIAMWAIGLFTLIAGVVGVGNIMLITVKERTKEFGIRKAIGASPISILKSVVLESIMITAIFGYIGMIFGLGLMDLIGTAMGAGGPSSPDKPVFFADPTVGMDAVIGATVTLIIAGVIAGLIPAIKAVRVKPIEAMRAE
ncbi:ABC transporter permease [Dysgonomonas sp. 520]|uniref:ABC transporter permease n=1 Tax=Dysgonomonas sp. 520 TaxID=2302931 RepID=UPI0013D3EDFC|nr:ABC transporter permease [Dysgonomonas sp. 520]NDW10908.1 ABC transporter permease [Dysgonomonas sp. 520]